MSWKGTHTYRRLKHWNKNDVRKEIINKIEEVENVYGWCEFYCSLVDTVVPNNKNNNKLCAYSRPQKIGL